MQHMPSETFTKSAASAATPDDFGVGRAVLDNAIHREAVRLMIDRETMAIASTLLACFMVLFASIEMGLFYAFLPLLAMRVAASLLTALIMQRTLDNIQDDAPFRRNFEAVTWGITAGGAIWAMMLAPVFEMMDDHPAAILVLFCVLAAGGLTVLTTSLVPRTMRIFICGHFTGLFAVMGMHFHEFGWVGFGGLAIYAFTIYRFGQKEYQQSSRSIRLQIENEDLAQELGAVNERLNGALATARKLSAEDVLTGLNNRRAFEERVSKMRDNCLREHPSNGNHALALMLLDLDHFKCINDQHGHLVGDSVLSACAKSIQNNAGDMAVCGRWGGEEFIVALNHCDVPTSEAKAETLRAAIAAEANSDWPDGLCITVSIGLAWWQDHETLEAALARADKALYRAKSDGRNRVHAAALTLG